MHPQPREPVREPRVPQRRLRRAGRHPRSDRRTATPTCCPTTSTSPTPRRWSRWPPSCTEWPRPASNWATPSWCTAPGPIGLMFVRLATLRGANVISVDQSPWRLQQAQLAGAVRDHRPVRHPGLRGPRRADQGRDTPHGRGADVGHRGGGAARRCGSRRCARLRPGATAVPVRRDAQGRAVLRRLERDALRGVHAQGRLPPHAELRAHRGRTAGEPRRSTARCSSPNVRPLDDAACRAWRTWPPAAVRSTSSTP